MNSTELRESNMLSLFTIKKPLRKYFAAIQLVNATVISVVSVNCIGMNKIVVNNPAANIS